MIVKEERGQRALQRSVGGSLSQVETTAPGGGHVTNITLTADFPSALKQSLNTAQKYVFYI